MNFHLQKGQANCKAAPLSWADGNVNGNGNGLRFPITLALFYLGA